jgi:hypothetical protein
MAQPVPERDIPQQPWRGMALAVTILVLLLTSLWEWKMRTLELIPGGGPVVIIGDSRILFDSDLDRTTQLIGVRPLQLAIAGGSGLPILENIADDPHFHGLAIVGMAETAYFDLRLAGVPPQKALALSRWESPSKRGSSSSTACFLMDWRCSTRTINSAPRSSASITIGGLARAIRVMRFGSPGNGRRRANLALAQTRT